jgi:hypothetical protein
MGLGLPTGGAGNFIPYLKYNAKAGRFHSKIDEPGKGDQEVKPMTAIFDLAQIKTGKFKFAAGVAPDLRFDSSIGAGDAQGDEGYKPGFYVLAFAKSIGGLREFTSNAGVVNEAMNELYDAYIAAPEATEGKLPVVKCVKEDPIDRGHGANYKPVFAIQKWVDRPAEMPLAAAPVKEAAITPKADVPPPAESVPDEEDEFA